MKYFLPFLFLITCSQMAFAAIEKKPVNPVLVKPKTYVLCKNKDIVRTIRIEMNENGCEAKYTKAGVDRVIGFGRSSSACNPFLDNVQSNLEKADWRCRAVRGAKITAALDPIDE